GIRSCTILAMTYLLWLAAEAVLPHALTRVTGGGHFGWSHAIVNVTVVPASSSGLTEMRSPAWTFAGKVNVPGFETCSTTRSRSGSPMAKLIARSPKLSNRLFSSVSVDVTVMVGLDAFRARAIP